MEPQNLKALGTMIVIITILTIIAVLVSSSKEKEQNRINGLSEDGKNREILKLSAKRNDYKTSHLLHLILSVVTGGIWLFVWVFVTLNNSMERRRWEKKIDKIN